MSICDVHGSQRSPLPTVKWPLKSTHQTSLGETTSENED